MKFNFLKIKIIQILLNLQQNLKLFLTLFLVCIFGLTATFFGIWNLVYGYLHLVCLFFLVAIPIIFILLYRKSLIFFSTKNTVNWIETKNFSNINPLSAIKDKPAGKNINVVLWGMHIRQTEQDIKKIIFYLPKFNLNDIDPLKIRFIFTLFFIISIFWSYTNGKTLENLARAFQLSFENNYINNSNQRLNILAWTKPPDYTGLSKKKIEINKNSQGKIQNIKVPYLTELLIQAAGPNSKKLEITLENKKEYLANPQDENINLNLKLNRSQKILLDLNDKTISNLNFDVVPDYKPSVTFFTDPETINESTLRFISLSEDDYRIAKTEVVFIRPKDYEHFKEKQMLFSLPVLEVNDGDNVKSLFYKNISSHLWAGSKTQVRVFSYDDLSQKGIVSKSIILPKKKFTVPIAKNIYGIRTNLAKKKISVSQAKEKINEIFEQNVNLYKYSEIKEIYDRVIINLSNLKKIPLSVNNKLYKNLWELAMTVEEGKIFSIKNNLEQIEQSLFDSISEKETDKINTNVKEFKETIKSLLDLKNKEGKLSSLNNQESELIKNQIDRVTKAIQDLLKTGSKEELNEKMQDLRQLADTIKNPKTISKKEAHKEQKKKEFINKLSELLNDQEKVMEESFNEAANRGKFKQSSEGSGGRTSKEKQDNLRNTLGNIMRDIGETENEIPQELGRADRAMRQATRELENGRPEQASNAQGRAVEMLQRGMNKMRINNSPENTSMAEGEINFDSENKESYTKSFNNSEYQGSSLGGRIDIPEENRILKAQKIAKELYSRYNEAERSDKDKRYIKNLLDWY